MTSNDRPWRRLRGREEGDSRYARDTANGARPPFDASYAPKPAWQDLLDAFMK